MAENVIKWWGKTGQAGKEGWLWKGLCGGDMATVPGEPSWIGRAKRSDFFPQVSCLLVDAGTKPTVSLAITWGFFGQMDGRGRDMYS